MRFKKAMQIINFTNGSGTGVNIGWWRYGIHEGTNLTGQPTGCTGPNAR